MHWQFGILILVSKSGACIWITHSGKTRHVLHVLLIPVSHTWQTSEQSSFQTNASTTQKQIKKSGVTNRNFKNKKINIPVIWHTWTLYE